MSIKEEIKMQLSLEKTTKKKIYCCQYCDKGYTRKTEHIKHEIVCKTIYLSKREQACIDEESTDIPGQLEQYKIILELAKKVSDLTEWKTEVEEYINKKKKKIQVTKWLELNRTIEVPFFDWQKKVKVTEEHFQMLFEEKIEKVVCQIIDDNTDSTELEKIPITCFKQKANIFYILHPDKTWKRCITKEFEHFIGYIQQKLIFDFIGWKEKNYEKIKNDDAIAEIKYKLSMKVFFDISSESLMSKFRCHLYNRLKNDVKNIFEYDFEY
jgi:hypothetical protein